MTKVSIANNNNRAGQESSNIYSFAIGQAHKQKQSAQKCKDLEPEDIEDTFDSGLSLYDEQHLKYGLQKHVFTRRVHLIKRGPWASFPDHGPRKWIQPSDHVLTRYPDYQINARYPDCEACS